MTGSAQSTSPDTTPDTAQATARDAGRVVIVGAGLAGFSAATELRRLGHVGPITVVDGEPATYDRPPLSKRLFEDDFTLDSLAFASAAELADLDIDARFGLPVTGLTLTSDAAAAGTAGTVTLADGTVLDADTVLLATGGRARVLPVPGTDLPQVGVLRTFTDAEKLRAAVTSGTRVAVVGAGLIGAELASALLGQGAEVTLIDPVAVPLVPAVGELLATHLQALHAARGIRVVTGTTESITVVTDGVRVAVRGADPVIVDRVVVGIGMVPDTRLAEQAGIRCDNGIVVDAAFRTSAPGVYAAGDVARVQDTDGTLTRREEHWEAAQLAGQEAAHALLGLPVPARGAGWFWSDRHGHHLESVGRMAGPGEIVVRPGGDHPTVFLLADGRLVGAAAVDEPKTIRAARGLIDRGIPVTAGELSDPSVQLRKLLKTKA